MKPSCASIADAAGGDIDRRRVEQGAVVGERDVVQVVGGIVGVECAPAAVGALHALDPLAARGRCNSGEILGPAARSSAITTTAVSSMSG